MYHHQNLTDGLLPLWRYGRAWWGPFVWGWSLFYRNNLMLASIHRSGLSVYLAWFGFYVGLRNDDPNYHGRWRISWSSGRLSLEHPWIRQDGWDSRDPKWRRGPVHLRIVDWLISRQRCEVVTEPVPDVVIPMPEGCYRAQAKRETRTWRRRWYWPLRRRVDVWLQIPGGIPFAGKGENSWDCGDDGIWGIGGGTVEDAIANAVGSALRSRRRHGHDSKGTGREPRCVVNAGQPTIGAADD